MPAAESLQRVKSYLANSKTFASLPESDQLRYLAGLEKAQESKLVEFLQVIEEEDRLLENNEIQQVQGLQAQQQLAEKLGQEIRDAKVAVQQAKEEEDHSQSAVLLSQMEEQLKPDSPATDKKDPTRKKFLGIF